MHNSCRYFNSSPEVIRYPYLNVLDRREDYFFIRFPGSDEQVTTRLAERV